MQKTLLLTFILILSSFSLFSNPKDDKKKEDLPEKQTPTYKEGLVYSLPQKGLKINIKAKRINSVPGPYSNYAKKYLGIADPILTENEKWELVSIWVDLFTEADPHATFKILDSTISQISVLENGIIAGIGTSGTLHNDQIIGSDFFSCKSKTLNFNDLSSDDYYEIIVNPETGEETTEYKSIEDKAREAADYLIRLRKKRAFTILSPDDVIPEDGKGYEVFIKEAIRLEKEYVALFAGKSTESYHTFSYNFVPGSGDVKNEILFRFSEDKGVLPKRDISGKPILLEVTKNQNVFKALDKLKNSENPNAGERGYWYRIPVSSEVRITDGINTLYQGNTLMPQFGVIAPIPDNLLSEDFSIEYNIETGTIKSVIKK